MRRFFLLLVLVALVVSSIRAPKFQDYMLFQNVEVGKDVHLDPRNPDALWVTSSWYVWGDKPTDAWFKASHETAAQDPICSYASRFAWEEMPVEWIGNVRTETSVYGNLVYVILKIPETYTRPQLNRGEFYMNGGIYEWVNPTRENLIQDDQCLKEIACKRVDDVNNRKQITSSTRNKRFEFFVKQSSSMGGGLSSSFIGITRVYVETGRSIFDRLNPLTWDKPTWERLNPRENFWTLAALIIALIFVGTFVVVRVRGNVRDTRKDNHT